MRKISKKKMEIFVKIIERILLDNNFRKVESSDKFNPMYEWVKETKDFGKVYFNPDNSTDRNIYSIFGMFEDIEKVKNIDNNMIIVFNINPYSGKCNFHNSDLNTIMYNFNRFLLYVNRYQ